MSRLRKQEFKLKSLSHQTKHLTAIFKLINPQKCPHKIFKKLIIKITQWNINLNNFAHNAPSICCYQENSSIT